MTANGASAAKTVPSTTRPHACSCALLNASVGCGGRLACSSGGASGRTIGCANTEAFGEVCSACGASATTGKFRSFKEG
eukprot:scaffold103266_cov66-Phaeocystis_antarctica.AAC.4